MRPSAENAHPPVCRIRFPARRGLTLIEMLVVLAILAVLTTLAVSLTNNTVDQARFDATQRQLQAIKDAIVGPVGQPDAPSFVGDVGRLPEGYIDPTDTTGEIQLAELWANPSPNPNNPSSSAFPAFGPCSPLDPTQATATLLDPSITVLCGWRGPYITLAPGQNRLRDGWGNPFAFLQADGLTAITAIGVPIGQVHSAGGPSSPFNQLQALPTSLTIVAGTGEYWNGLTWSGTVSGSIASSNPTSSTLPSDLTVLMYVPDVTKSTTGYVRVMTYHASSSNGYRFTFPATSSDPNYNTYVNSTAQPNLTDSLSDTTHLYSLPLGPKVLRVYPYTSSGAYWQPPSPPTGSAIVNLKVPFGGVTRTLYYP